MPRQHISPGDAQILLAALTFVRLAAQILHIHNYVRVTNPQ